MPFVADAIMDSGLAYLTANGDRLDLCSQEPANHTEATSTYTLANKTGAVVGSPQAGDVSGRKVTVAAVTDGSVTGTGTATHWALSKTPATSALLAAQALASSLALVSGGKFTLAAFDIEALGPAAGAAAIGTIEVLAGGWEADMTLPGTTGGTFAFGSDAAPNLVLTVSSRSWTTSGTETTLSRTVYAKAWERLPYPNQTSKNETESAPNITLRLVLSDYIFADDTITGVTIAAGTFTDVVAGANAAGTLTPTNSSTLAYFLPIATWLTPDREHVKTTSFDLRLAVAHAYAQQGQTVRAVKFIVTDTALDTVEAIVTSMVSEQWASGLYSSHFKATIDLTALLQQNLVTIDAIIYPWVGDAYQISANGNTYPHFDLSTLRALTDLDDAYGVVYAYVDGVGGGTPAVHETPATAATTPYATISAATTAIAAYNNTNFGRNNLSGGVIRLTATTHTHSSYANKTIGEIPLLIEAANPANKATTIYQDAGAHVFSGVPTLLKLKDITLKQQGSFYFLHSGINAVSGLVVMDGCYIDQNGQAAYAGFVDECGRIICVNCTGTGGGSISAVLGAGSKGVYPIGCAASQIFGTASRHGVGNKDLLGAFFIMAGTAARPFKVGPLLAFNHIGQNDVVIQIENGLTVGAAGFGLLGNVFERHTTAGPPAVGMEWSAGPHENIVDIANTVVGERTNYAYNDTADVLKRGVSRLSVYFLANIKGDVFATAAYVGNWPRKFHVGDYGLAFLEGSSNADIGYGVGSWLGEVAPPNSLNGTAAAPIDPDWVADASLEGTGTGNGDYTPGPATELQTYASALRPFPVDQLGRTLPTDGSAVVGAIQQAP